MVVGFHLSRIDAAVYGAGSGLLGLAGGNICKYAVFPGDSLFPAAVLQILLRLPGVFSGRIRPIGQNLPQLVHLVHQPALLFPDLRLSSLQSVRQRIRVAGQTVGFPARLFFQTLDVSPDPVPVFLQHVQKHRNLH